MAAAMSVIWVVCSGPGLSWAWRFHVFSSLIPCGLTQSHNNPWIARHIAALGMSCSSETIVYVCVAMLASLIDFIIHISSSQFLLCSWHKILVHSGFFHSFMDERITCMVSVLSFKSLCHFMPWSDLFCFCVSFLLTFCFSEGFSNFNYNCISRMFLHAPKHSIGNVCSESTAIALFCSCCQLLAIITPFFCYFMTWSWVAWKTCLLWPWAALLKPWYQAPLWDLSD